MWNEKDIDYLINFYPVRGKSWCMKALNKTESQIRHKAAQLRLKQDKTSLFFKEWQEKARVSKIGKKRPNQADVIRKLRNEGKINISEEGRLSLSQKAKDRIKEKGHPRGSLGLKHTQQAKQKMSEATIKFWQNITPEQVSDMNLKAQKTKVAKGINVTPRKASWKGGWREIGGINKYYRSRWEANYARYLHLLKIVGAIKDWEHEPKTFWFEKIRRGTRSYLPDFLVIDNDGVESYHEIKGWMDDKSKTKLKRMKIYYPKVNLVLIEKDQYMKIGKDHVEFIDDWEFDSKGKI
jgi:hypothetical protein